MTRRPNKGKLLSKPKTLLQNAPANTKFDIISFITRLSPILAVLAFGLSIFNVLDTRNKWDELNNANVVITDLRTSITGEVSLDSLKRIDFGIENALYGPSDAGNKINIYHFLVPYDSNNNRIYLPIKPTTIASLYDALNVMGISNKLTVYKAIKFDIYYKNIGKTVAKNCIVKVSFAPGNSQKWEEADINNDTLNSLHPSNLLTMVSGEFQFSGNVQLPESIKFKVYISYTTINSEHIAREEIYSWQKSSAKFSTVTN